MNKYNPHREDYMGGKLLPKYIRRQSIKVKYFTLEDGLHIAIRKVKPGEGSKRKWVIYLREYEAQKKMFKLRGTLDNSSLKGLMRDLRWEIAERKNPGFAAAHARIQGVPKLGDSL